MLREELGFKGVIVSDAIGMAAILKNWPPRACAMAIKAGCDQILLKADDESRTQRYFGSRWRSRAARFPWRESTRLWRESEARYDQGLFKTAGKMDPEKAQKFAMSKPVVDFSWAVAEKALVVMGQQEPAAADE